MQATIICVGTNKSALEFVLLTLQREAFACKFITFQELSAQYHQLNPWLWIVDAVPSAEVAVQWIRRLRKQTPQTPILTLVPVLPYRLRYRVIENGSTDYLPVPFLDVDLKVRVRNLLTDVEATPALNIEHIELSEKSPEVLNPLLELLFDDPTRLKLTVAFPFVLRVFRRVLKSQHIFYFDYQEGQLTLQYNIPDNKAHHRFTIEVDKIPGFLKAVKFQQAEALNRISTNNPIAVYFRSTLNLNIRSFMLFPIVFDGEVKGVAQVIRYTDEPFTREDFEIGQLMSRMLVGVYRMAKVQHTLQENLDNRIWKYYYQFLDRIINQLSFGILVISEELRILYLNRVAAQLLNLPDTQNITYKRLTDILDRKNVEAILKGRHLTSETYERPELLLTGANGEKVLVGFTVQEYRDENDGTAGYIISLKDITYSKELQEEMRRMERLASLGVMASGIAHEIRNPLAGIKAIAQTFEEELTPEDPKQEYVRRIIRQVNRLDEMLKALFSYAKPQKPNRAFCSIEEILREVTQLLRQKFRDHNVQLTESVHPDLPQIFVDSSQIQQVLMNLILNSIEAIDTNGEIKINIQPVQKGRSRFSRKPFYERITRNPYVQIHIHDNGCGIPPEHLKQIFNPFFTTKNFGTGLGLSIVYQIVKENNGVIYFESEVGKGTDCYLFLPAYNPQESEYEQREAVNDKIGSYK